MFFSTPNCAVPRLIGPKGRIDSLPLQVPQEVDVAVKMIGSTCKATHIHM